MSEAFDVGVATAADTLVDQLPPPIIPPSSRVDERHATRDDEAPARTVTAAICTSPTPP